jgi:hypothetical protein
LILVKLDTKLIPVSGSVVDNVGSTSLKFIEVVKCHDGSIKVIGGAIGWLFIFKLENNSILEIDRVKIDSYEAPTSHYFIQNQLYLKYPNSSIISVYQIGLDIEKGDNLKKSIQMFSLDHLFSNTIQILKERAKSSRLKARPIDITKRQLSQYNKQIVFNVMNSKDYLKFSEKKKMNGFYFKLMHGYFKGIDKSEIKKLMTLEYLPNEKLLKVFGGIHSSISLSSLKINFNFNKQLIFTDFNRNSGLLYCIDNDCDLFIFNSSLKKVKMVPKVQK